MSDQPSSVSNDDAAGGQFAKAFLPGLVLGLVVGLFIGAWIPPFFGEKPDLISGDRTGLPQQTAEERHREEAGHQTPAGESTPDDHGGGTPAGENPTPEQPANPG